MELINMEEDYRIKLLNDLGFDTKQLGAKFFIGAVMEVQEILNGIEGIKKDVPDYLPKKIEDINGFMDKIYVDEFMFFFECGKEKYFKELNNFISSRKTGSEKDKLFNEVFEDSMGLDSMVINFSKYSNQHKEDYCEEINIEEQKNDEKKIIKKPEKQ